MKSYDVVIVGGGHAGAEAAWAAARMGASTALVTMRADAIGRMSCNPAIGGLGKGHMVREIDALGGLMGLATDATGIQFRMLNRRKGPAVWAPRAQADRNAYPAEVQRLLGSAANLEIIEGMVEGLATEAVVDELGERRRIRGVGLDGGRELKAGAVVITTGTFMRALMHCGRSQTSGGRVGEATSTGISAALESLGIQLGRLKTGTPPRIHRDSIDYGVMEEQPGDESPTPFSFLNETIGRRQVVCWITYTNERTHAVIRDHLHEAPMYNGQIRTRGPRYCPSIEDKVVRFADKPRHQVFLEPEGYDNERIYCNGISTSLPAEVQGELVRTIPGLERAEIVQPGYAVEYDFVPTHQTTTTLECKQVAGLFLAGQINGTSGYEEAAGQGLAAGINAVQYVRGGEAFVLGREQAYIGVMIDDLITRPPDEPYRMFTSRAEYRLHLRSDNADQRLTAIGRRLGVVDDARWDRFQEKMSVVEEIRRTAGRERHGDRSVAEWIRRSDVSVEDYQSWMIGQGIEASRAASDQVFIDCKYAGYLERQSRHIEKLRRMESAKIPAGVDYERVPGLRNEARQRFGMILPRTLGQASRISGISPSDVTVLWVYLSKYHKLRQGITST
ncbi:MAG: tRNA uridine-5-carboxymethylaminomethyl(34) synthesis enzyme MnmG [Phycisphaerales bacterium]|nr:tRNA uridine-5-carboxymethylaminomethyl(34) synthesis enzyme MnmG [Phycisphaerales bacterium]